MGIADCNSLSLLKSIAGKREVKMIINKTPHPVMMVDRSDYVYKTFQPDITSIRLKSYVEQLGTIQDVPISRTVFGEPEGLPEEEVGTLYIVSQLVKTALSYRNDLLVPAEVVRDQNGNIIGCRSLGR